MLTNAYVSQSVTTTTIKTEPSRKFSCDLLQPAVSSPPEPLPTHLLPITTNYFFLF